MAIKKSELYSSFWSACDDLRGGMNASQYKDYVLVLLFIRYVSDKYVGVPFAPVTIPEGAGFRDMAALKGKPGTGDHQQENHRPAGQCQQWQNRQGCGQRQDMRPRVPKSLIVSRYFAAQQAAIREQEIALESVTAQMTELEEEPGAEEGAFFELNKVNKANVTAQLKKVRR